MTGIPPKLTNATPGSRPNNVPSWMLDMTDMLYRPDDPNHKPGPPLPDSTVVIRLPGKDGGETGMHIPGNTPEQDAEWTREHTLDATGKRFEDIISILYAKKHPIERRFSPISQRDNAAMTVINEDIQAKKNKLIDGYYSGSVSLDEVKEVFKELARKNFKGNVDSKISTGNDTAENLVMMQRFYSDFRGDGIGGALRANGEKGRELVEGNPYSWKYYNADYYYMSEDFTKAITEAMNEVAAERGEQFTVPDYSDKKHALYNNFNTAWVGGLTFDEHMIDTGKAPPPGFEWFFQEGDREVKFSGKTTLTVGEVTDTPKRPQSVTARFFAAVKAGENRVTKEHRGPIGYGSKYNALDFFSFEENEFFSADDANGFLANFRGYHDGSLPSRRGANLNVKC